MTLGGELVSLLVSIAQELGIVVGVGALTLTLIGHLLSLHANQNEATRRYVRAAHHLRAMALFVIVLSGVAAVVLHVLSGSFAILVAPVFVFKWLLIALIVVLHFTEWHVSGIKQDVIEGFEGATWYALFIVHTLALIVQWGFLVLLYAGWVVTFGIIWAVFVWIMRGQSIKKSPTLPASKPTPKAIKPSTPPVQKPTPPPPTPKPTPKPVPPPQPKPVPPPPAAPKVEVHPNHTMLPMVAELDLPAPKHAVPPPPPPPKPAAPPPPPPAPAPAPAPKAPAVELVPEFPTTPVPLRGLDDAGLPALHVMPKRPEDIGSSKRGPVVKMDTE